MGSCVSVMSVIPESTLLARMFVIVLILRIYKITCITAVGSGFAALGQHTSIRIRGVFAFITCVVRKENVTSQCSGDRVCEFPVPGGGERQPNLPALGPAASQPLLILTPAQPKHMAVSASASALLINTTGQNTVPSHIAGVLPV